jgi:hypothetical protein
MRSPHGRSVALSSKAVDQDKACAWVDIDRNSHAASVLFISATGQRRSVKPPNFSHNHDEKIRPVSRMGTWRLFSKMRNDSSRFEEHHSIWHSGTAARNAVLASAASPIAREGAAPRCSCSIYKRDVNFVIGSSIEKRYATIKCQNSLGLN